MLDGVWLGGASSLKLTVAFLFWAVMGYRLVVVEVVIWASGITVVINDEITAARAVARVVRSSGFPVALVAPTILKATRAPIGPQPV